MKKRETFDPVSLSFSDVLTCVFGAAIVLFLIFVAIVSLEAVEGSLESKTKGFSHFKMKSIQKQINRGFATATIRLIHEPYIQLQNDALDTLVNEQLGSKLIFKVMYKGRLLEGVQYNLPKGLPDNGNVYILGKKGSDLVFNLSDVYAAVSVGGMMKCLRITHKPNDSKPLFVIGKSVDGFVESSLISDGC